MSHEDQSLWKKDIAPYERPRLKYSIWQIINTLVPFLLLWFLAYWSLSISYLISLAFIIPASGFLIRIFIIFHDCCHYSFFKNRKANEIVGTFLGIFTCVPYHQWRHTHTVHHATSGNLDKRGTGDIWTLTVNEYLELTPKRQWVYRMYRNPFIMFVVGPIYIFLIEYRRNRKGAGLKERLNTYITNLGIVSFAGLLCLFVGWEVFLLIQGPIFLISGMAGIWLFYVQHQFEESYYEYDHEWEYIKAAMQGSSFYNLPKILHWITGNIGFHHIHHLSPRVPNYYLEAAHNTNAVLRDVSSITLKESFRSLHFRIWNEETKKFVGFSDVKQLQAVKAKQKQLHE